ncbi:MAG: phospholipase D-like domain-containing protein [Actinomycetota bacterium]|nr:phospholipase D-like domain-containing protein [Actinomycetota bacterium]
MRLTRNTPRSLLKRGLVGMLYAQITIIVSLMTTSAIRKRLRGTHAKPFPVTPPTTTAIGVDNTATTFTYGEDLFADMLDAIAAAKHRILFETFIWKGDSVGKQFKQALIDAADRGVDVYVIYDGFANLVVSPQFLRFPPTIRVLRYPVFSVGMLWLSFRRFGRDHRKILVVDGEIGYVGGYNIGKAYATKWRDTHIKIQGASVWDLDNAFVDFWNLRHVDADKLTDHGKSSWDSHIRAHRNVPRQLIFPIRGMYLEAIDRSQHHIYITQAYFIPDGDILSALLDAAKRGVEVRILMPEISNHVVADWLARGFYSKLLDGGVRILLYKDAMVHAKTATIDGKWSTIGTANIDRLSLTGNYEINLEILDDDVAKHMEVVFSNDSGNTRELTADEWHSRPWVAKACELILAPLRPLL